jgi:phosphate-selective porin OprO/OprP
VTAHRKSLSIFDRRIELISIFIALSRVANAEEFALRISYMSVVELVGLGVFTALFRLLLKDTAASQIRGPFSFQAEYGWNFLNNATGVAPTGTTLNPPIVPPQDYVFNGGYLQVAYTLTGENRAYDRRIGTLAREYYGKSGPYSNAWLIRDENGNLLCGWGAWEVAARYSYVNLNDGAGLNRIQGGVLNGVTLGLNWYANTNLNVMLDWACDQRSDLATGTTPGWTSGVGVEVQFQF